MSRESTSKPRKGRERREHGRKGRSAPGERREGRREGRTASHLDVDIIPRVAHRPTHFHASALVEHERASQPG